MQAYARELWDTALGRLELQVTRPNFETWLRDTRGLRIEDDRLVVGAPTDFAREWLDTRLKSIILKTIAAVAERPLDVVFEVFRGDASPPPPALLDPAEVRSTITANVRRAAPVFNPAFTFDAFVTGEENRLAYNAALAAATGSPPYHATVICGPVGLGKTHLLHAIGHRAVGEGKTVVFATAERFANEFATAARDRSFQAFRERYRRCDVLLLDDLQFLEGKEHTQEEFFHTFDELAAAGAHVAVTADRPPALLGGLMPKLRSRLAAGLVADIQPPAYETRFAIVAARARRERIPMDPDIVDLIAARDVSNVRELEGGFNRVVAFAQLRPGDPISPELARKALAPFADQRAAPQPVSASAIIDAVCRHVGVDVQDLASKKRDRKTSYARHLVMYLLRELGRQPLSDIGRLLGGRDHSTVIHAVQRIAQEITCIPETRRDVEALRSCLMDVA
jgi:chromosomal replication initiator protein